MPSQILFGYKGVPEKIENWLKSLDPAHEKGRPFLKKGWREPAAGERNRELSRVIARNAICRVAGEEDFHLKEANRRPTKRERCAHKTFARDVLRA